MKTIITYQELSQLTNGNFTFTQKSETEIMVTGKLKILLVTKEISTTFKIERIGYSSIDLSSGDPGLVSTALMFLPGDLKKAVAPLGEGKVKIDLRCIPELQEITKRLKLENIKFAGTEIIISISPRP